MLHCSAGRRQNAGVKPSTLNDDLQRLASLAYHRLEWSGDLVREFHRLSKSRKTHPDFERVAAVFAWMFVPITLWPIKLDGLLRGALDRIKSGRRLDAEMLLLIEMLPSLPSAKAQAAATQHEHAVQSGSYESLIQAEHKFDEMERRLADDPAFRAGWRAITERFDVARFRDHKTIIRRRLVQERNMRPDWEFRWSRKDDRFREVFDVFCQRWNLYGMRGDQPLLQKLTVNLTPFGTMIFIPAYWSFDPKRDLRWRAISALHKARGVQKQGAKLAANRTAKQREARRAAQLLVAAKSQGLHGTTRTAKVMDQLGWDPRTDERALRRLVKKADD